MKPIEKKDFENIRFSNKENVIELQRKKGKLHETLLLVNNSVIAGRNITSRGVVYYLN